MADVSAGHVIWAYEDHICDLYRDGKSVAEIRRWLREDWSLNVGEGSIRAVLEASRLSRANPAAEAGE